MRENVWMRKVRRKCSSTWKLKTSVRNSWFPISSRSNNDNNEYFSRYFWCEAIQNALIPVYKLLSIINCSILWWRLPFVLIVNSFIYLTTTLPTFRHKMHFPPMNFGLIQEFRRIIGRRNLCSLTHHFKLVVIGAGPGGLSVASRFCRKLPEGSVAVVEPNDVSCTVLDHYAFYNY